MSESKFIFKVLGNNKRPPEKATFCGYLVVDNWDDWFRFGTMYTLYVFDEGGTEHLVGSVKIGRFNFPKDQYRPDIPIVFEQLGEEFFSVGQDDSYYDDLNKLSDEIKQAVLRGLNDIAADSSLFERAKSENVTQDSLFRAVTPSTVRGQFRRIIEGGARLSKYNFSYTAPRQVGKSVDPITLSFEVVPESNPPTNIHVLIGRNGVGKTYLLDKMTNALVGEGISRKKYGSFTTEYGDDASELFANLISVTFSAFDPFIPIEGSDAKTKYLYIGLKRSDADEDLAQTPKTPKMLAMEFVRSVRICLQGKRKDRWVRAIAHLETDHVFQESEISHLPNEFDECNDPKNFDSVALSMFNRLSSGHKIVLLTITKLVEFVAERSLVLLDEPEAHLHPPLLSAFVRALSDLLVNRNGVAIIATHSPVVLQEVPRKCAWKLRRNGYSAVAERPELETFGENTGVLTREVFGLEVAHSGFLRLITDAIAEDKNYDQILQKFDEAIGAEGKAILRSLLATKRSQVD